MESTRVRKKIRKTVIAITAFFQLTIDLLSTYIITIKQLTDIYFLICIN